MTSNEERWKINTLPDEIILQIALNLPWYSVIQLAGCDTKLRTICTSDKIWNQHLQIVFHDVNDAAHNNRGIGTCSGGGQTNLLMQRFLQMAGMGTRTCRTRNVTSSSALLCKCNPGCAGRLFLPDGSRCPCVVKRTKSNSLRVGALHFRRSRSSSLNSGGFETLREILMEEFAFGGEFEEFLTLDGPNLSNIDVLVICTTEGPSLNQNEVQNLQRWVDGGGALLISAFSNWSRFNHFASVTVGWLGIRTRRWDPFGQPLEHTIDPMMVDVDVEESSSNKNCNKEERSRRCKEKEISHLATAGPFGQVKTLTNQGETLFQITNDAYNLGAIPLTKRYGEKNLINEQLGHLVFFPPADLDGQERKRHGRILVCSNYHWLCDRDHWNGGFLANEEQNSSKVLLLNFIASAVAARHGQRGD